MNSCRDQVDWRFTTAVLAIVAVFLIAVVVERIEKHDQRHDRMIEAGYEQNVIDGVTVWQKIDK